jgi:hypothetical protein
MAYNWCDSDTYALTFESSNRKNDSRVRQLHLSDTRCKLRETECPTVDTQTNSTSALTFCTQKKVKNTPFTPCDTPSCTCHTLKQAQSRTSSEKAPSICCQVGNRLSVIRKYARSPHREWKAQLVSTQPQTVSSHHFSVRLIKQLRACADATTDVVWPAFLTCCNHILDRVEPVPGFNSPNRTKPNNVLPHDILF